MQKFACAVVISTKVPGGYFLSSLCGHFSSWSQNEGRS